MLADTRFDNLAHGPRGTETDRALRSYRYVAVSASSSSSVHSSEMRAQACTLHVSAPPQRLISVRRLNVVDGTLTLLCVVDEIAGLMNPAFSRCHPRMPVLYACTESVKEEGLVRRPNSVLHPHTVPRRLSAFQTWRASATFDLETMHD